MTNKNKYAVTFIGMVLCSVFISAEIRALSGLNEKQKAQLLKDVVKKGPFLKTSSDIKHKKFTLGKFFHSDVYRKLQGNDILGYEYDEGFRVDSSGVCLKTVRTVRKTAPYKKEFINSLKRVPLDGRFRFSMNGLTEIGIALLDVEPVSTRETLPGALVEVYFRNRKSGKCFFYRFGTGKRAGLNVAFTDIWGLIFSVLESFR